MTRRRLVVLASAATLLVMGVLAAVLVVSVTQTDYGRDAIRDWLSGTLAKKINGKLYVGRIRGGLLTGLVIDSIEIRGPDDSLFLAAGEIRVDYDPRDLADKRVLISRLEILRPVVNITKERDGEWNFRHIFPRGGPKLPKANRTFGDFVVVDSAIVRDAKFTLRMPWNPPDSLKGARRAAYIDSVLASRNHETVRDRERFLRTWRWSDGDLWLSHARIADPDSAGRFFQLARLDVNESDPPFRFRNVRGGVRWLGDSIWLDLPHFDLPASTGSAKGKVVWGSGLPNRYDVTVLGDSVSLDDVAWVYPTLPRTGGGKMKLHIGNAPGNLSVIDYAISEMDVRSTHSRLRGRMTYGVGGTVLVVKDVELQAEPLDFRLIRQLNGKEFPYPWAGTITGRVRARGGPLTDFVVDASEFVFRDANVPGAVSIGSARGRLDILYPAFTVFEGLDVRAAQLDLRTLQYLNPNFPRVNGYVSGTATLDSSWLDVRFSNADLRHVDGDGDATAMTGSGRATWGEQFMTWDLDLEAQALSFTTLARSYPDIPLRGTYRGPLRVRGTMENLDVATALTGPGGTMAVSGNFDLYPAGYRARARANLTNANPRVLLGRDDLPPASLTMTLDADLAGDSLRNLAGTLALDSERSLVNGTRLYPSAARLVFGGGRVRVDSLRVESSAGSLRAFGALGLHPARRDTLAVRIAIDSLGGLRPWLGLASNGGADDSLGGSLRGTLALVGSIDTLSLGGTVTGRDLFGMGSSAHALTAAIEVGDLTRIPRGRVRLGLDTATVAGIGLRAATLDAELVDRGTARWASTLVSANGPIGRLGGRVRVAADTTALQLDSLSLAVLDRRWALARPANVLSTSGGTVLDSIVLRDGAGGRLAFRGAAPMSAPVNLAFSAERFPLADLGALMQSRVLLSGMARMEWRAEGMRAAPLMRFEGAVENGQVGDMNLERVVVGGNYANRRLASTLSLFHEGDPALRASASIPVDLSLLPVDERLLDDSIVANVRTDSVTLGVIEAFSPALRRATGTFSANVDVGGTWRQPRLRGALTVTNGAVGLTNLGVRVDRLNADVRLSGDSVTINRFSMHSGRTSLDTASLTGVIDLRDWENPAFDLYVYARDFHAMSRPRVADMTISTPRPGLHLAGNMTRSTLTGGVVVTQADIRIPELAEKRIVSLDDPELARIVDTSVFANRTLLPDAPPRLLQGLSLRDVQIRMGEDVWLRSEEASIKLGGAVNVTTGRATTDGAAAEEQLALDGALTAERGTYRLFLGVGVARTFNIEEAGTLRFFGDPDLNPTLDIRAVHTVRQLSAETRQDVRIQVQIGGTLARPVLQLSSPDQRLSQSDLISYLVTGQPSFEVTLAQQGGVSTLASSVFVPSVGSWISSTGFVERVGLDVLDVSTASSDRLLGRDQGVSERVGSLFSGARLGVGKQIGNRTFVSANAGLCQFGEFATERNFNPTALSESVGLRLEHRFNHGFSVSLGSEPSTNALFCAAPGAALNTRGFVPTPRQYGFDLFKTWQF